MRNSVIALLCLALISQIGHAQTRTVVALTSGSSVATQVLSELGSPLTAGTSADGDGAVLQLGYFIGATLANVFGDGTFIPLSGQGSANTAQAVSNSGTNSTIQMNQTSIGDLNVVTGGTNGVFGFSLTFTLGSGNSDQNLPAGNPPLAIRFFNGTSINASTFYNTVSMSTGTSSSWLWKTPIPNPTPNTVSISLNAANLHWESVDRFLTPGSEFRTTIPIPEASVMSLVGCGLFLLWRRDRG